MIRASAIVLLLLLPFTWVVALPSGAGWLEWPLPGGLPLGNLFAAMTMASWPAASALLATPRSAARRFAGLALLSAFAWLPASALLAGNLALNFSGERGTAWFALTLAVLAAGVISLAWSALHRLRQPKAKPASG